MAIHGLEPVIALIYRQLSRAIQQVSLHRLARGERIAGKSDAPAIGLDLEIAIAATCLSMLRIERLVRGRGLAGAQGQRRRSD